MSDFAKNWHERNAENLRQMDEAINGFCDSLDSLYSHDEKIIEAADDCLEAISETLSSI